VARASIEHVFLKLGSPLRPRQGSASRAGRRLKQTAEVLSREFRDDQPEWTAETLAHIWWNSGVRVSRFIDLLQQARDITKARISAGQVTSGEPGRRHAMAYCLTVLRGLLPKRDVDA
jgi:hypothetical protein